MTEYSTDQIQVMIRDGDLHRFYASRRWRSLALAVIREHHGECYLCKAKGKYARAKLVHHVRPLKLHPELAYSRTDEHGSIQLMPLCFDCHEKIHEHGVYQQSRPQKYTNEELW